MDRKRPLTISISENLFNRLQKTKVSLGFTISEQIESYINSGTLPETPGIKKFNMAACTDSAKEDIEDLQVNGIISPEKIIFNLQRKGYECSQQQSVLVAELLTEYLAVR